jgi:sec-independent protein translocase protein TatC
LGIHCAGLYAHEKRLGIPLIISSTSSSSCSGMSFCYFFVFGQVFTSSTAFAPKSITPAPDIEAYLSFVMTMFLAFGIAFEVPVALVVLVKLGVVTVEKLKEWRSYFIVGAFVVAAVVTPPDVVSQLALAIPMCLLYELGILACVRLARRSRQRLRPRVIFRLRSTAPKIRQKWMLRWTRRKLNSAS